MLLEKKTRFKVAFFSAFVEKIWKATKIWRDTTFKQEILLLRTRASGSLRSRKNLGDNWKEKCFAIHLCKSFKRSQVSELSYHSYQQQIGTSHRYLHSGTSLKTLIKMTNDARETLRRLRSTSCLSRGHILYKLQSIILSFGWKGDLD